MSQDLKWEINNIFEIIKQPIDIIYKLTAIEKCKSYLGVCKTSSISDIYFKSLKDKKESGVVYTPKEIAKYMIENTLKAEDIINNPFLKIIDPACGCGNIIIPCFAYLQKLYEENLEEINKKNKLSLNAGEINKHIVENNLFGFDTDDIAIKLMCIDLFCLSQIIEPRNFKNDDFLFNGENEKYDVFIGNPPYIGHKSIDKEYAQKAKIKYRQVYSDKGDIAYCFYSAALDCLNYDGKITFISSRYFLESPSGAPLRKLLKKECSINKIVDFYGIRPFKDAGIDPVILFLNKTRGENTIEVLKPTIGQESSFLNSFLDNGFGDFQGFKINKNNLEDDGWVLIGAKEKQIIDKIKHKCKLCLKDICESYQGIVTGCDKAFIVDKDYFDTIEIEKDIIKPWIKSSSIKKGKVDRSDKFIIYSNLITDQGKYKNCLRHIKNYKDKLMERRECKKGLRKWYELQWGRVMDIFEGTKVIFPYKSSNNRFAVDKGSYFSADVYALVLKEEAPYTYEYIVSILNSRIYEFYFKSYAKKLGENIYEYYPNTVMKLYIPPMEKIEIDIDSYLFNYFALNAEEIAAVNNYVKS